MNPCMNGWMGRWMDFLCFECESFPHKLMCYLGPYLMMLFWEMLEILGDGRLVEGSKSLGLCPQLWSLLPPFATLLHSLAVLK